MPAHLIHPLWDWLAKYYFRSDDEGVSRRGGGLDRSVIRETAVRLRVTLDWENGDLDALQSLFRMCVQDQGLFLDLLDLAVACAERAAAVDELDGVLVDGGSSFEVAPDRRGLSARTPEAVRDAAEAAVAPGDRAAELLAESWRWVYGPHPSPGMGYREAIRAVEAVACPIVIPQDKLGTLGGVIARLKSAPAKFVTVLQGKEADPVGTVCGMLRVIWKSQLDRHGSGDEEAPLHVSQQEAEAALQLAITLVEWFRRGFIRLIP